MIGFHPNRLARKIIAALIVFSSLLTVIASGVQLWIEYGRDVAAIDTRFAQVERSYIDTVSATVWEADIDRLNLQMKGIIEFPDFAFAEVRDEGNRVLASSGRDLDEDVIRKTYPLVYEFRGELHKIGKLTVAASLDAVYVRTLDRFGVILLSNAIKTAIVAGFLFFMVYWLITKHLDGMAKYARKLNFSMDPGELTLDRGRHGGRDELDDLVIAVNEMKIKLFEAHADARQLSDELEVRVRGRTRALTEEIEARKRTADKLANSEARLRDVAEAGSDWIWEMGPDLKFTYISGGGAKHGAVGTQDIVGHGRAELGIDRSDDEKWQSHLEDLKNHRPFRDFEYELNGATGEPMHVRVSGKPIFDKNGEFLGYRGVSSNITEQIKAGREAQNAREQLHVLSSAVEQNPSAVFITNERGVIEYVNEKFTELTGYTRDEAVGRNPRILKSPDTPLVTHKAIWASITNGYEWRGEIKDRKKNGDEFWAYATIAPVKNDKGNITHFVATHEDISERKAAEEMLRDATQRAEVANRTKSEIMANMSHELRTPLNAIIGFSDVMLEGVFGKLNNNHYEEYARDIHDSGKHLLSLINDILDVSAIEAGKLVLRSEVIKLDDVATSSMKLVRHRADEGRVSLAKHIEKELPDLFADERRVKQILLNLLSNAVKFTPEGGTVTLSVVAAPDGGVRFEVEDTGIGMDEEGIQVAMSQFGQVDSTLARKYEGTGLGLPLTKSLVEAHDGTLDIRSRLGHGTTVVAHFPPARSVVEGAELSAEIAAELGDRSTVH